MKIVKYKCDLCGRVVGETAWWDNAYGGEVTICADGLNRDIPKFEHLCHSCRSSIVSAIKKTIEIIKNSRLQTLEVVDIKKDNEPKAKRCG